MLRRAHREILLRAIALERMRDHARAACDGALLRSVCRSGIDDDDFVAELSDSMHASMRSASFNVMMQAEIGDAQEES